MFCTADFSAWAEKLFEKGIKKGEGRKHETSWRHDEIVMLQGFNIASCYNIDNYDHLNHHDSLFSIF